MENSTCVNCIRKAIAVAQGGLFCKHLMDSIAIGKAMGENHALAWQALLNVSGVVPAAKHHVSAFLEDDDAVCGLNSRMTKGRASVSRSTVSEWVWMPPSYRVPSVPKTPKPGRKMTAPIIGREVSIIKIEDLVISHSPWHFVSDDEPSSAGSVPSRQEADEEAHRRSPCADEVVRFGRTYDIEARVVRPVARRKVREGQSPAGQGLRVAVVRGRRRLQEVRLEAAYFFATFLAAGFLAAGFFGADFFPPTCAPLRPLVLRGTGSEVASVLVILSMFYTFRQVKMGHPVREEACYTAGGKLSSSI